MNELQLKVEALRSKLPPDRPYVEVDEGWYGLVTDCDAELAAMDANYQLLQVKEKFGGLRYYFIPSQGVADEQRDAMYEVVARYEKIASQTCEATGEPGVLMKSPRGRLKTLNPEYAAGTAHLQSYVPVEHKWVRLAP